MGKNRNLWTNAHTLVRITFETSFWIYSLGI